MVNGTYNTQRRETDGQFGEKLHTDPEVELTGAVYEQCAECGEDVTPDKLEMGLCADCKEELLCRWCGERNDNGEGSDGLCGNCADRASCTECGEHIHDFEGEPDEERTDRHLCTECRADADSNSFDLLTPGDWAAVSHAEGDFDAADYGFERIEAVLQADGTTKITASVFLDFGHLQNRLHIGSADFNGWLDQNREHLINAVGDQVTVNTEQGWDTTELSASFTATATPDSYDALTEQLDQEAGIRQLGRSIADNTIFDTIAGKLTKNGLAR